MDQSNTLGLYRIEPYGPAPLAWGSLAITRCLDLTPDGRTRFCAALAWHGAAGKGSTIVWNEDIVSAPGDHQGLDEVAVTALIWATVEEDDGPPAHWPKEQYARWCEWRDNHAEDVAGLLYERTPVTMWQSLARLRIPVPV